MDINKINKIDLRDNLNQRDLGDEIIVIISGSDELHSFKQTGMDNWKMLNNNTPVEKIIQSLCEEYKIDKKTCTEDVIDFLMDCQKKNLISISQD